MHTGYSKEEIEGRNCRFLQGKNSNPSDVSRIREAIEKKKEILLCLLNYRKDGSSFLNQVKCLALSSVASQPPSYYLSLSFFYVPSSF